MDENLYKKGICGKLDKQLCFLLVLNDVSHGQGIIELVKNMASKYKGDPINFFYTDKKILIKTEGLDQPTGYPLIYIIKGKRKRYAMLKGPITVENISK